MFYNLIYRSPLWGKKINSQDRNIRVLVAGTVLYIGMYVLLQSKYADIVPQLQNYKKYIYHIFISDLATVSVQMYFTDNVLNKNKNKKKKLRKNKVKDTLPLLPFIPHNIPHNIPNNPSINNNASPNKPKNSDNGSVGLPVYESHQKQQQQSVDVESDFQIPVYRPIHKQLNENGNQINVEIEGY
ncbi:MAG: hypothetical protein MUO21_10040 [Nitrososphaeraceae archaeon]|nr:hypothetical protein [Nitrososphaeraceae archaeon]